MILDPIIYKPALQVIREPDQVNRARALEQVHSFIAVHSY